MYVCKQSTELLLSVTGENNVGLSHNYLGLQVVFVIRNFILFYLIRMIQ